MSNCSITFLAFPGVFWDPLPLTPVRPQGQMRVLGMVAEFTWIPRCVGGWVPSGTEGACVIAQPLSL